MMKTYTEDPPSARLCFLLFLVAFWGLCWLVSDHVDLIEWLGVHRMSPPFADLRSLTGGVDCLRQGIDPSGSENPCDPWNRPLNYPPPWLDLFFLLGLSGSTTVILGLLTAILFYTALFVAVFPKEDRGFGPAIGWSVFVFSPAILLGVERGNNDYVIFFILAVFVFRTRRFWLAYLGIWLAGILKLYPFFGLARFLQLPGKSVIRVALGSLVLLLGYVWLMKDALLVVWANTPKSYFYSWGRRVVFQGMATKLEFLSGHEDWLSLLTAAAVLLLAYLFARRSRQQKPLPAHFDRPSYLLGAGIFLGAFLLGNNWNYRQVFLLFVVAIVMECKDLPRRHLLLFNIAAVMWSAFWSRVLPGPIAFAADECLSWLLFLQLAILFFLASTETFPKKTVTSSQMVYEAHCVDS